MRVNRLATAVAGGVMAWAAGCGGAPAPPAVDAAAEADDAQRIKAAGDAERKPTPKGRGKAAKPERNRDDDD